MKYGKVVNCDGKLMTALEAARKTGLSPRTVMKLAQLGRPIARRPHEGREPQRVPYEGQMLTAEELAPILGVTAETVRARIRNGVPLAKRGRRTHPELIEHDGRKQTVRQWAAELRVSRNYIYARVRRGLPLDAPPLRVAKETRLTESGVYRVDRGEGENGLYWDDDLECRVWHMYCGGDELGELTLVEVAALWDLSRERIRQIEMVAIEKIRRDAKLGRQDAVDALTWFRLRSEQRSRERMSAWEQAEMNAPGFFDTDPRGKSGQSARSA